MPRSMAGATRLDIRFRVGTRVTPPSMRAWWSVILQTGLGLIQAFFGFLGKTSLTIGMADEAFDEPNLALFQQC
jgi:hypothetical protein